ncbi:putative membrane protein [Rhodococcus sp. LBL1]|nr:putative membrane protein [Rhodococcus sp. LBL1]MDH6686153.1 putative membrane protein [Rhodococcus sp. LBL2]
MNLRHLYNRAESASFLDGISATIQHRIQAGLGRTPIGDRLRGDWLGHPVHPVLVAIPIGAWTSSLVFDVVLRDPQGARRLIGVGLAAAPPTIATGWADWSERDTRQRRVGLLHAGAIATGIVLMLASFRRHKTAPGFSATALSALALTAVGVGGALGGHLVFGQGAGLEMASESHGPAFDPVLAEVDSAAEERAVEEKTANGHRHHVSMGRHR